MTDTKLKVDNRFYPYFIEEFMYEPTKDDFNIVEDSLRGKGVVAVRDFKKGEILFRSVLLSILTLAVTMRIQMENSK